MVKREVAKAWIDNLVELNKRQQGYIDKCQPLFGRDCFEGDLFVYIEKILDDYMNAVAEITGINKEALSWFIYENDCGKKGYTCSHTCVHNGTEMKICSVDDFLDFEYLSAS